MTVAETAWFLRDLHVPGSDSSGLDKKEQIEHFLGQIVQFRLIPCDERLIIHLIIQIVTETLPVAQ
jgi:hypothetical protein